MRVGIIGAGNLGGTLGRRLAHLGHDVTFGLRDPMEGVTGVKGGKDLPKSARIASISGAAHEVDAVVLATPWAAVPDAIRQAGSLSGIILIDATNPLSGGLTLDVGPAGESGAERVQRMAPRARVVKCFNTTGFGNIANPLFGGLPAAMFYAGDEAGAKAAVRELVSALGFDPIDAGPLFRARQLEHMALLWISLASGGMGREIAFRVVQR